MACVFLVCLLQVSFDFFLFCWWFPCCGFLGYGLVCLTVIVCRLICALGCFNSVDLFSCYLIFICDLVSLCLLGVMFRFDACWCLVDV